MSKNMDVHAIDENETSEMEEAMPQNNRAQNTHQNEQRNDDNTEHPENTILEELRTLSINSDLDEMRKFAKSATYIAGRLALVGQTTVFYAGPNTGKTLISLKLVSEAVANATAGDHVYQFNFDDTYDGLMTKAELGNRHGFHVISPEKFPKPNENFAVLVALLVESGEAKEAVFILDTIKKFTDVMDKRASSAFMTTCREFTSAGGTIIALAHINKHKDTEDAGIPAGTSDVLDDCDCAYVMNLVREEQLANGMRRTVEFSQKKARGPVVKSAMYSYVENEDSDYVRMFNSVTQIDGSNADKLRAQISHQREFDRDADLISAISDFLVSQGSAIKKDIINHVVSSGEFSRRNTSRCLERWDRPTEEGGIWISARGPSNSSLFTMNLPPP